jgi:hypothetical protein
VLALLRGSCGANAPAEHRGGSDGDVRYGNATETIVFEEDVHGAMCPRVEYVALDCSHLVGWRETVVGSTLLFLDEEVDEHLVDPLKDPRLSVGR